MTEQTQIDPKAALAALEQAFGYYQPEPFVVQDSARDVATDVTDEADGFAYYDAA